jgi:hypothetical protein
MIASTPMGLLWLALSAFAAGIGWGLAARLLRR